MPTLSSILTLAAGHAEGAAPSAAFALAEAHERIAEGREDLAHTWALRSLSHSVGVFHADYLAAAAPMAFTSHGRADDHGADYFL